MELEVARLYSAIMTRTRSLAILSSLVSVALAATLSVAPAAARTVDPVGPTGLSSAASGVISGRLFIQLPGGGTTVAANAGVVRLYSPASDFPAAQGVVTSSGNFTIAGLPAGQYIAEFVSTDTRALPVREWFNNQRYRFDANLITLVEGAAFPFGDVVLEPRVFDVERIGGENRFDTAANVSERAAIAGSDRNIVIVNGLDFPDALGAGPLAARLGAPLLMVTRDSIPDETRAELERLDPLTITIVGGTGVVSTAVEQALAPYVGGIANVARIAGENRYDTSRKVVEVIQADTSITELFIATGRGFPDALAAVPAAGSVSGAVLLVDGTRGSLDIDTAIYIDGLDVPVTIVGGTGVVSAGIESQLSNRGVDVERVAGSTRYATAIAIAVTYFPSAEFAYLANGLGFADALAIGPVAAAFGAPVYLTQSECLTDAVYDDLVAGLFSGVTLVGGAGVLSSRVQSLQACSL
ncbi:MAG: hypothetical protein C0444_00630 [Microbacterium sp.]|nr:hypothetical protein [Microbacterium sp.]MBA4346892.1 hypothetical protein [Microbacterium sp.]